jgi:hypothetical protein
MRNTSLGLFCGLLLLTLGALLVIESVANADANQSARVVGGATLLSLGFLLTWLMARSWWEWRKLERKYRDS